MNEDKLLKEMAAGVLWRAINVLKHRWQSVKLDEGKLTLTQAIWKELEASGAGGVRRKTLQELVSVKLAEAILFYEIARAPKPGDVDIRDEEIAKFNSAPGRELWQVLAVMKIAYFGLKETVQEAREK